MLLVTLVLSSALAFYFYGGETLFAARPRREYDRYGMPKLRVFVGSMQLLGATGLLVGLAIVPIGIAAAAGLALMMVLGLVVRFRIHDAARLMVPAATLATINVAIVILFVVG